MSQPSKHFLDAFKASSASAASPPARAPAAPSPATTPSLFDSAPRPHALSLQASQVKLLAAVFVLALVCAFMLGRASVGAVAASESDATSAPETPAGAPQQAAVPVAPAAPSNASFGRDAQTPAEAALLDPRNLYTIKLLEYSPSDANKARALETLRYLTDQAGLPAALSSSPKRIVVLVGAAPDKRGLAELLRRAKTIAGPPPLSRSAEFSDAYTVEIDEHFSRKP